MRGENKAKEALSAKRSAKRRVNEARRETAWKGRPRTSVEPPRNTGERTALR